MKIHDLIKSGKRQYYTNREAAKYGIISIISLVIRQI